MVQATAPLHRMVGGAFLFSFHPETVLFRPGGVNLQACLCGVPMYASAQPLDFLARTKNPSFPNWKPIVSHPEFPDGHYLEHGKGAMELQAVYSVVQSGTVGK